MRFRRAEDFVAVLEDQSVVGVRVGRDGEVLEKSLEGRGGVCGHRCGGAAGRGGGERVGGGGVKWWSGGGVSLRSGAGHLQISQVLTRFVAVLFSL